MIQIIHSRSVLVFISLFASFCHGQGVEDVVAQQEQLQRDAQESQQRIEALDDESLAMLAAYNREQERYEDLTTYNENLRQLLANQAIEKQRFAAELAEVEVVRQAIVPLMVEMVDVLEQFIELDQPMLVRERSARLETLKSVLTRSDVDISEKYRRVIESYQIEAEYGQSLEVYEGPISLDGKALTVDFLRVGRVGLYFLSLDREEAGIWNPATSSWYKLDNRYLDAMDYAVRVAREQAPPNLIELPLWSGEAK